jgi:tRNA A37 threonylcarbamoyladenosine biosynthesis protein TsaE
MNIIDTTKPEYTIDTKAVQNSFEQELKQYADGSARIFFSGKYGVGKTKFLERFFESYKNLEVFPFRPKSLFYYTV